MLLHENNQLLDINSFFSANQALPERENLQSLLEYRKLIQTSLDGFWVVRAKDARILEANVAFCNIVGYSREELLTMSLSDLEIDESPAETAAHIKKVMEVGHDRFETRHRHKQGHQVDLEVCVSHSELDGGTNYVFARDITARKRMELAIAAREHEFRTLAENLPDNIARWDREGRYLYLNPAHLSFLRKPAAEILGKRAGEIFSDGRLDQVAQALAKVVETGQAQSIRVPVPQDDGSLRIHEVSLVPERNAQGEIVSMLGIGRDMTAIRDVERRVTDFFANVPGFVFTFRMPLQGPLCFPFVSPGIENIYGLKPEDVKDDMGLLHALAHPEDKPYIERTLAEAGQTLQPFAIEFRMQRLGWPMRWIECRSVGVRQADGSILWHGIMLDITERKQKEALVHSLSRKLKAISRCNQMLVRAENEHELLNGICKLVCDEAGYLMAWVGFAENDEHKTVRPVAQSGYENGYLDGIQITWADTERGQIPIGFAIRTGVASINNDFQNYPRLAPWREAAVQRGFRSSVAIPLVSKGQVLGALNIYSAELQSFENEEVELLQELANDIAYGVQALRTRAEHERAEKKLRESESRFRTLFESATDCMLILDMDGLIVDINRTGYKRLGYQEHEMLGRKIAEFDTPEYAHLVSDRLAKLGKEGTAIFESAHVCKDGTVMPVEINTKTIQLGGESRYFSVIRDITERKQAERQLRELTAHLQTVREEEKAHLAREIHDDLGSTLAALNLKLLHLLDVEFSEDMKQKPLFARLESMLPLLRSSIATTRRIITDMRPDVLDNLGLFAALKWQAEQFYKHTDIGCRIVCANDHGCEDCEGCEYQMDKALSINLFRIFQEALTNVSRHSGASRVEAEFHITESAIVLSIQDNGRGLPEGHTIAATSYGIRGMRERIQQMGGEIEFDSPPDGGFSVIVRVPRLFAS